MYVFLRPDLLGANIFVPRSMLGMHMDANSGSCEAGRGASYVSSVLRFALAGGVFRWLQISAGRDFERRAQVRHPMYHN